MDYGNVLHIQSTSIILDDVFNQHFFANVQCLRYVCVCVCVGARACASRS